MADLRRTVHVVAIGARTPVGLHAAAAAAAVRGGISRIAEHPFLVDLRGEPVRVARDASLDPGLFGAARLAELARSALAEVSEGIVASAGGSAVPLFLALPEPRAGFRAPEASAVASALEGAGGHAWEVRALCDGHAAGLEAIRAASALVASGERDVCVAGGVDSFVDPDALLRLDGQGRLAAAGVRGGFPPGEGAAFVALASDLARRRAGLPSLATIAGAATAQEEKLPAAGAECLGEGLGRALRAALAGVVAGGGRVHEVYCDLNGERLRAEEWGFAALRIQEAVERIAPRPSGVASWGDAGAATGPLLAVLAVQASRRGYARGPLALLWAGSDGGQRAAIVLERPCQPEG